MEQPRPTSQKPPAGLAGVLNGPERNRDSAYFSSADISSKRKLPLHSPLSCFSRNGCYLEIQRDTDLPPY